MSILYCIWYFILGQFFTILSIILIVSIYKSFAKRGFFDKTDLDTVLAGFIIWVLCITTFLIILDIYISHSDKTLVIIASHITHNKEKILENCYKYMGLFRFIYLTTQLVSLAFIFLHRDQIRTFGKECGKKIIGLVRKF